MAGLMLPMLPPPAVTGGSNSKLCMDARASAGVGFVVVVVGDRSQRCSVLARVAAVGSP